MSQDNPARPDQPGEQVTPDAAAQPEGAVCAFTDKAATQPDLTTPVSTHKDAAASRSSFPIFTNESTDQSAWVAPAFTDAGATQPDLEAPIYRGAGVARSATAAWATAPPVSWALRKDPGQSSADTLPLPWLGPPLPRKRGQDTTILAAILTVLITVSGVLLSTATYNSSATVAANGVSRAPELMINDTLANASLVGEYGWSVGKQCMFFNNAYHALAESGQTPAYCLARSRFHDFTFQVSMTIKIGGSSAYGGLIFRADPASQQFYVLLINTEGSFVLLAARGQPLSFSRPLATFTPPAFRSGAGQANTIAITARGSTLAFYVNQSPSGSAAFTLTNTTYSAGQLGFVAADGGSSTDVAYSNAQAWTL